MTSHIRATRPLGFTLIELCVTIAIAAILMTVAVPSFSSFARNSELVSAANSLIAGVNAARSEAMKYGTNALLIAKDNSSWKSGWTVCVDKNRDNACSVGDGDLIVSTGDALPSYFATSGDGTAGNSAPYLLFDESGYARAQGAGYQQSTIEVKRSDVARSDAYAQTRRIKISTTGRLRVCTPTGASDTSCAATGS